MDAPNRRWAALVATLVAAAYVVPYTWLADVKAWYGSFLFWSLFALTVILIIVLATRRWVD